MHLYLWRIQQKSLKGSKSKVLYENLTSPDVKKEAAEKELVTVLPAGSIEARGPHMPTGTDSTSMYNISGLAED